MIWANQDNLVMTCPISFGKIINVVAIQAGVANWNHAEWMIPVSVGELKASFKDLSESPAGVISLLEMAHVSVWSM
jgi:hypothetical protein